MKTLYISDLDGTLLSPSATLTPKTEYMLNEALKDGIYFTVATARTNKTVEILLENVNINVPAVLMNGVIIYDLKEKKYINVDYLHKTHLSKLQNWITKLDLSYFAYEISNNTLTTYYDHIANDYMKDFYEERLNKYKKPFVQLNSNHNLENNSIIYFALLDQYERLLPLYKKVNASPFLKCEFYQDIYNQNHWYLEIFDANATKYNAVNYLREHYGFDYVIGFGDNLNDLPLFHACNESYAVANAKDEVKQMATTVIESNQDDGVAKQIYTILRKQN